MMSKTVSFKDRVRLTGLPKFLMRINIMVIVSELTIYKPVIPYLIHIKGEKRIPKDISRLTRRILLPICNVFLLLVFKVRYLIGKLAKVVIWILEFEVLDNIRIFNECD